MPTLLHKCMTKATTAAGDQAKYGPNWLLARRALLKVFDDHIECRDWRIDYANIRAATLRPFPSILGTGYILAIETPGAMYHFGLNPGKFWKKELPFAVTRLEKARLRYSLFSLVMRLILIGCIGYLVWKWFQ